MKSKRTAPPSPAVVRPLSTARLAHVTGGFLDSGPSDANRVIERHELPGNQGA